MDLIFTTDDAKMNVSLEEECNVFEIWNNDHWNVIHLSDEQLEQLKRFCIRLKGKTNENILS